jgi:hypothetical protein
MTDVRHVWPREPLTAERWGTYEMSVLGAGGSVGGILTDAEFAAAFVDAAVLTELLAAARAVAHALRLVERNEANVEFLLAAVRTFAVKLAAFDAAMLPDRGK